MSDRAVFACIGALSASVLAFLVWLIYFQAPDLSPAASGSSKLPALNSLLNTMAATCLLAGYNAIRRGRKELHKRFMLAAVVLSGAFLVSYITYHQTHGDTPFPGQGAVRPVYFSLLISHIIATAVALPLILTTLFYAASGRFEDHRRIARRTFPLWLYVSVTGVAIFVFLRAYTG